MAGGPPASLTLALFGSACHSLRVRDTNALGPIGSLDVSDGPPPGRARGFLHRTPLGTLHLRLRKRLPSSSWSPGGTGTKLRSTGPKGPLPRERWQSPSAV